MTEPLDIIFDDFGKWLLGYRIEFSCLYIFQKGRFALVLCGYEVQLNKKISDFS